MQNEPMYRGQFTFYASFLSAVEQLPKSRQYEALSAIIRYALYGERPETLSRGAAGVFNAICPILDAGRCKAANRLLREKAGREPPVLPTGRK